MANKIIPDLNDLAAVAAGQYLLVDDGSETYKGTTEQLAKAFPGLYSGLEQLAADPVTNLVIGRTYWNTVTKLIMVYDGTVWAAATLTAAALTASRALVSGSDGRVTPSSVTDTELGYLSGVTSGLQSQLDTLSQGVKWKPSVKAASTANLTLSGAQTIDGVSCIAGDRVLAKDQSTGSQNGIYVVAAGAWSRATDADTAAELLSATVTVEQGTANADKGYRLVTDSITVGSTSLVWTQIFGVGTYTADGNGIELTGSSFGLELDGTSLAKSATGLKVNITGSPVGTTDTQALTNKDIDGGTASNTSRVTIPKAALTTLTALTRKQGTVVYDTTSNKLMADDGTNLNAIGSGQGELNVIGNPNDAGAGWSSTGAGVTVVTTTTTGELPLNGIVSTGIKITPVSGTTDYAYYRWTMPAALKDRKLKIEFHVRPVSGYATGDIKVDVYTNTASNYAGTSTRLALSTDVSAVSSIPNQTGKYQTTFDADSSDYYGLRFTRVSGTTALVITAVVVGPGIQPQGAVVSEWIAFTPGLTASGGGTITFGTGSSQIGFYRRVGDSMEVRMEMKWGSSGNAFGTSGAYQFTVPASLTVNTGKIADANSDPLVGTFYFYDSSAAKQFNGSVTWHNASSTIRASVNASTTDTTATGVGPASPVTIANSDQFVLLFTIPILEWQNSGTLTVMQDETITEWKTFVPNVANITAYGTGGALGTCYWRRNGDSLQMRGYLNIGTSPTLVGSAIEIDFPNGLLADTNKINLNLAAPVGTAFWHDQSGTNATISPYIGNASDTIRFAYGNSTILNGSDLGASDTLGWDVTIPIAAWAGKSNGAIGYGKAAPDYTGLVTSHAPIVKSSIYTATGASPTYAITSTDGYETFLGNPTSGNVTFTLPAASSTYIGRRLRFKNLHATAALIISGTIDNVSTANCNTIRTQYGSGTAICDGSAWYWETPIHENGTFTPTFVAGTNVASTPTGLVSQFTRVGNVVTVSGLVSLDPTTASTNTTTRMTIPVATTFTNVRQGGGVAMSGDTNAPQAGGRIYADTTNNGMQIDWNTTADVANRTWTFHYTYLVL